MCWPNGIYYTHRNGWLDFSENFFKVFSSLRNNSLAEEFIQVTVFFFSSFVIWRIHHLKHLRWSMFRLIRSGIEKALCAVFKSHLLSLLTSRNSCWQGQKPLITYKLLNLALFSKQFLGRGGFRTRLWHEICILPRVLQRRTSGLLSGLETSSSGLGRVSLLSKWQSGVCEEREKWRPQNKTIKLEKPSNSVDDKKLR